MTRRAVRGAIGVLSAITSPRTVPLNSGAMDARDVAQWSPSAWFLVTPPQPKATALVRLRICELLERTAESGTMAVVLAPPGYGKTTALAAWAARTQRPVAWLSVTHDDHTTAQLVAGLLSALHTAARGSSALTSLLNVVPDAESAEHTLNRICAALRRDQHQITIVIDDAHRANRTLVDDIINVITERSDGYAHIVVAGTRHLAEWFSRMLAMGDATLIGSDILALTSSELSALAEMTTAEAVLPTHLDGIMAATAGWPIAARIGLSSPAPASAHGRVTADDGLLTEFIAQSVLGSLSDDLFDFVLAATTCTRLDAPLAQALSGREDAAALLNECVQLGLFLDRYVRDDASPVYQWHDVFARHCRILLRREQDERARKLNLIAANWLAHDFPGEATLHALSAGDAERAVQIIRRNWLRMIIDSHAATLHARCLALPNGLAQAPDILLIRACCLDIDGDTAGATLLRSQAHSILADSVALREELTFVEALTNLFLAHDRLTLASAADNVRAALGTAATANDAQIHAIFLLGWAELRLRRNPIEAIQLLTTAHRDAHTAGLDGLARRAAANLGFAYSYGGNFTVARQFVEGTDDSDIDLTWSHYDGGIELVTRGHIDMWQNDLVSARANFETLIKRGGHSTSYAALARVFFCLATAATGNAHLIAEAAAHVRGISNEETHGVPWPAYRRLAAASLAAATGDYQRAMNIMGPVQDVEAVPVVNTQAAEIYRRAGHPNLALAALARVAHPDRISYVAVSALVTTAVIMRGSGDPHRSHVTLERALDIAVPEGILLPFMPADDDDALRDLITEHAAWGTAHENFIAAHLVTATGGSPRDQVLGSALSRREREIFGYLCTTMTADEIAAALHVSVNTVRTHQRAIYRKLGVSTRREAVKLRI